MGAGWWKIVVARAGGRGAFSLCTQMENEASCQRGEWLPWVNIISASGQLELETRHITIALELNYSPSFMNPSGSDNGRNCNQSPMNHVK